MPAYQRPYSWGSKEALQLFRDISTAAGLDNEDEAEPDYFLGTMLMVEDGGETDEVVPLGGDVERGLRRIEVVDGQQRLITVTILAAVLRDFLAETDTDEHALLVGMLVGDAAASDSEGPRRRYQIELRGDDQAFLERYVQSLGGYGAAPEILPEAQTQRAIIEVRDLFVGEIAQMETAERLTLARYLAGLCHVVVILTRDIDRAHRLFTIINDRGKPLQRNDILKAELISSGGQNEGGLGAGDATQAWDRAAALLGDDFEGLFSHIRTIHGRTRPQVIAAIRSIVRDVGGPRSFLAETLVPFADSYAAILSASRNGLSEAVASARGPATLAVDPLSDEIRRKLHYLSRLNGGDWLPPALLAVKAFGGQSDAALMVVNEIDRLAHLLRLMCVGANKRVRRMNAVVDALRKGHALEPGSGPFEISKDEGRMLAFGLRDIHRRNASACKLLLLRLNDEMAGRLVPVSPASFTVEHVLPGRPSLASVWRQWFPDGGEREACTECLGNLILVTQKQNEKARNEEFARKVAIFKSPDGNLPLLDISREVVDKPVWTPEEVRARELRLLRLIGQLWRVDVMSTAERRTGSNGA